MNTTPYRSDPSSESSTVARNAGIDLLRGFAILMVVVHHLALPFRLPLAPSVLGEWLPRRVINAISFNGYEAVFVFFVISGYVITRRALERHGTLDSIDWRLFYTLRAARILPLLGLLLAVLTALHLLSVPDFVVSGRGQTLAGALLSALTMTLNGYEGHTTWLPGAWDVLWSLSIEEAFYLAFPVVCLVLPRRWLLVALGVLILSLPWTRGALAGREIWQEKAYLPGMSAIACGVLTALASQGWRPTPRLARLLALLGVTAIAAVFVWGGFVWRSLHEASLLLLCAGAASLLVVASVSQGPPRRGLGWLAQMGRWSYEIYLSHMFVVLALTSAYQAGMEGNRTWTFAVYVPAVILCALLGRWLHVGFSEPARRWLQARWIGRPGTSSRRLAGDV
jgi:peptidoglycan/LPS O-acetylase OafA/YrhL